MHLESSSKKQVHGHSCGFSSGSYITVRLGHGDVLVGHGWLLFLRERYGDVVFYRCDKGAESNFNYVVVFIKIYDGVRKETLGKIPCLWTTLSILCNVGFLLVPLSGALIPLHKALTLIFFLIFFELCVSF